MQFLPRRKRRWTLAALGLLLGLVALSWTWSLPTELERKFASIHYGMTREQAFALLGGPDIQENVRDDVEENPSPELPLRAAAWFRDHDFAVIQLNKYDRVVAKNYTRYTLTDKLRQYWELAFGGVAPF